MKQKAFWHTEPTIQFLEIINTLKACKERGSTAMLIAPTGHCKSYSVDKFCEKNPEHTYRITVNSLYKLRDLILELATLLNVKAERGYWKSSYVSYKGSVDHIVEELQNIKKAGGKPIIIIDEGENMEVSLLKMIKGLYDRLKDHCSIVLIGTQRMVNRMLNLNDRGDGPGYHRSACPELYRRFKAHHKNITVIHKKRDFKPFLDKYVGDKGLRELLCNICENYGELHDYLVPALEEADAEGKPLTEDFFRIMYNLPKLSKN